MTMAAALAGATGGRAAAFVALATLTLGGSACSSSPRVWSDVGGAAAAETDIHDQTVRFVVRHYAPARSGTTPAAFCLAAGRRSGNAARAAGRDEDDPWIPGARLLARLADLEPPVVSAAECRQNAARQEIFNGAPAVYVQVSEPSYDTANRASVIMRTSENPNYAFAYRCELRRDALGWQLIRCL